MTVHPHEGLPPHQQRLFDAGVKYAAAGEPAYNLSGVFVVSEQHDGEAWGLLSVPNALVRGIYSAMDEPGIELPPAGAGRLNAHVTVLRPEEITMLGGPNALRGERGKRYTYTLGRLVTLKPEGWADMERCWMVRVHSPELQALRRSRGLSSLPHDGQHDFHITVACRRRGVLGRNGKAKGT